MLSANRMARRTKKDKIIQRKIAKERMSILFEFAREEALNHRFKRADRYVEIAKKISMRYLVPIPKEYKQMFCKKCNHFLLPGVTSRVRTNRGKLVILCKHCNSYRRIPIKTEKYPLSLNKKW